MPTAAPLVTIAPRSRLPRGDAGVRRMPRRLQVVVLERLVATASESAGKLPALSF